MFFFLLSLNIRAFKIDTRKAIKFFLGNHAVRHIFRYVHNADVHLILLRITKNTGYDFPRNRFYLINTKHCDTTLEKYHMSGTLYYFW